MYSNGKFSGTRVYHSILNVSELCCDQPHWPTSLYLGVRIGGIWVNHPKKN